MRQIDLEPKDYRAAPVRGEPIFMPGAGKRALTWCITMVIAYAVCFVVQIVMSPLEPFVKWLALLPFS